MVRAYHVVACIAGALMLLGCGSSVVVSQVDTNASRGGSEPTPQGRCVGEERWTKIPGPPLSFVYGTRIGDEVLVWDWNYQLGYRFQVDSDTWREMAPMPPMLSSALPVAASSSDRFLVWDSAVGAAYDWATDAWTPMAAMAEPIQPQPELSRPSAGSPRLVFYVSNYVGGSILAPVRMMYDVANDAWQSLPDQSAPTARNPIVVWADTELLVWGGAIAEPDWQPTNTGARFDPSTMSWTPMSTANAPALQGMPTAAVWTGESLFVWGHSGNNHFDGGLYDPRRDEWTRVSHEGAPSDFTPHAVWTGKDIVVVGATSASYGIYDPSTDTWRPMVPGPPGLAWHMAIWDGCRVLLHAPVGLYAYEPPPDR